MIVASIEQGGGADRDRTDGKTAASVKIGSGKKTGTK